MGWKARRSLLMAALLVTAGATSARADTVLLLQTLPVNEAGTPFLLIQRSRISHVAVTKGTTAEHRFTVHLATEPRTEITFACNDYAIARQVLEALGGSIPTLDVTGRCRL